MRMKPHGPLLKQRRSFPPKVLLLGIGIFVALLILLSAFLTMPGIFSSFVSLWLPLILRWAHLIYGFAWIGTSFFFIFVENSLEPNPKESNLAGQLWTVHGGGIYRFEKYRTAPIPLPSLLHWFRWDAYLTWTTGFALLVLLFYAHPEATLIDPQIAPLSPQVAVLCSLGILIASWLVYMGLAASTLLNRPPLFTVVCCLLLSLLAYGLTHLFSGRGAFLQLGAVLGTIMAGNVLFVIIPSQKRFLEAASRGERLDPELVKRTHLRSIHNNYLAFPVLFAMMSNHFPFTFQSKANWLVLLCLLLAGGTVRHAVNLRQKRKPWLSWLFGGMALLLVSVIVAQPTQSSFPPLVSPRKISDADVEMILRSRCSGCHAHNPTLARLTAPPAGIVLENLEDLCKVLPLARTQLIDLRTMPPGNFTGMTEGERMALGLWIEKKQQDGRQQKNRGQ
ncbi:Predicted membrane protein [Methylacidiphilum infernorum V4]|uniref:Predicted membrane protein n=2 Tax=Candidatus Methylacidiphilum infernorum TaxID=511746 RepID=B3E0E5_METI4|nr:Predicted membrane protein [Methylacidiphilum infernorum V4]